jgi:hypothetical protein
MKILLNAGENEASSRMVEKMGFKVATHSNRLGRFGEFWKNFYSRLIIWSFNPVSLHNRPVLHIHRS